MPTIERIGKELSATLDSLKPLFHRDVKLTFIARNPFDDNQDILVSADSIEGLQGVLDRLKLDGKVIYDRRVK